MHLNQSFYKANNICNFSFNRQLEIIIPICVTDTNEEWKFRARKEHALYRLLRQERYQFGKVPACFSIVKCQCIHKSQTLVPKPEHSLCFTFCGRLILQAKLRLWLSNFSLNHLVHFWEL